MGLNDETWAKVVRSYTPVGREFYYEPENQNTEHAAHRVRVVAEDGLNDDGPVVLCLDCRTAFVARREDLVTERVRSAQTRPCQECGNEMSQVGRVGLFSDLFACPNCGREFASPRCQ